MRAVCIAAPNLPSWDTGVAIWDLSASVPVSRAISGRPGTQGKLGSGEVCPFPALPEGLQRDQEVFLTLTRLTGSSGLTFSREEQTWPLRRGPGLQITPCLCVFVPAQSPQHLFPHG